MTRLQVAKQIAHSSETVSKNSKLRIYKMIK